MSPSAFSEQRLPPWRRAVLKVGSSLLAANGGGLSTDHAQAIAGFVNACHAAGRQVVVVSSGAVAAGRAIMREQPHDGAEMAERQALAALGQARLIGFWQGLLDRQVAQVLLTHDDLRNRRRYLNARATLSALLRHRAVPVVNENDTVSVDELKLGDNDNLAAIVAALVDADVLFIATDIDGLYDADPRRNPDAQPVEVVSQMTPALMAAAGGSGSAVGTGGMRTKLEAAQRASAAGVSTVLFNGTRADVLADLARDALRGTRIHALRSRVAVRKHWLQNAPAEPGGIVIDEGAANALVEKGASLLPGGVITAEGDFRRGDMVEVLLRGEDGSERVARGVSQYSAADIRRIARRHSREIESVLGYSYGGTVIHRDDLMLV
ncbi:glutamate 5-kinase [Luteimonas composti]|uniref:Glutamate 5-kinase n=1 Tax=Luteimonas composti TaxID=398257 RepID=A0ABT6MQK1_9GAMM|nr:glutamate 5-kinase [Luteimonas composti]MDH7452645.1 glutamate 5-kinase [Luteimonas composti]